MSRKTAPPPPGQKSFDFETPAPRPAPAKVLSFESGRQAAEMRERSLVEKLLLEKAAKLHW